MTGKDIMLFLIVQIKFVKMCVTYGFLLLLYMFGRLNML
jgi:hypothetical protein